MKRGDYTTLAIMAGGIAAAAATGHHLPLQAAGLVIVGLLWIKGFC